MPVTETGTRARQPDESGYALTPDGLRLYYEVFGRGETTIVFLPATPISHSRLWKAQVPFLARHFRVVTYDGRGNGLSDHPDPSGKWLTRWWSEDCLTVMDATGTKAAILVGICGDGVYPSIQVAVSNPDRVLGIVAIAPGVPLLTPPLAQRAAAIERFNEVLDSNEGWFKHNHHYIEKNFRDFLEFFFGEMFPEPHSTKQIEDAVAYGLDGRVETLLMPGDAFASSKEEVEAMCRRVSCPVLIMQGDRDNCQPYERGLMLAELIGARHVPFPGSGHIPNARQPVRVNELIYEFAGGAPAPAVPIRVRSGPRVLLVSSPIGLGHSWRDVAIARALRDLVPGLQVEWLAQPPVTTVLEACGESIHPASLALSAEAGHVDSMMGEHELHAFHMLRRMDEISIANFMVFHDLVKQEHFDLWIADEGWEIDHFLHENPGLKTAPYAWLTDFVGLLPMASGGEREAFLTTDYNAEMLEHIEQHPQLRNLSVFIGNEDDIVPQRFGPGLPSIREWTTAHYEFTGYVLPFDPRDFQDRTALKKELGYDVDRRLIVATVGGSAVGMHLLRRIAEAFEILHAEQPETEVLLVCGPRIDPAQFAGQAGVKAVGYVHDLFKTLACCDLAVVQAGLSTTMELIANRRPFIHIPLKNHFEQNFHVANRIRRYGAPPATAYGDATPRRLAELMRQRLDTEIDYKPVESDAAIRAARLLTPLLQTSASAERRRTLTASRA